MRALLLSLIVLSACARPNNEGRRDLGQGYSLLLQSESGPGRCDLWTAEDWQMSNDDLPGFCVMIGQIEGPEPRWILWRGEDGQAHPVYDDQALSLSYAGSEEGPQTNIKLLGVSQSKRYPIELLWGDEADASTWQTTIVQIKAVRYAP